MKYTKQQAETLLLKFQNNQNFIFLLGDEYDIENLSVYSSCDKHTVLMTMNMIHYAPVLSKTKAKEFLFQIQAIFDNLKAASENFSSFLLNKKVIAELHAYSGGGHLEYTIADFIDGNINWHTNADNMPD
jgi:hypothetical protein